jgi:hypothetical protein
VSSERIRRQSSVSFKKSAFAAPWRESVTGNRCQPRRGRVNLRQFVNTQPRILYCHCAYAQIVPKEVKEAVLRQLCESGVAFDAVADLCELSARQDPSLQRLAAGGAVKIAACYPRAVKWLFASAGAPLPPEGAQVLNMRVQSAAEVASALLSGDLQPNLPAGKVTVADKPAANS